MLTMFAVQLFTTVLAFLTVGVQASPLSRRDVIVPKITNPKAGSVWPVGSVQTVTWDTSDFPPDSQITNPIGKVILGFEENDSLNLDFANPLADGFKLRDGSVTITVPNVPPRDDYIVVLMGDSGNTSPQFAITSISAPASSPAYGSSLSAVPSPPPSYTSLPITGSVTTQDTSSDTPTTTADSTTYPLPTSTTPTPSSGGSLSTSGSPAASSAASTSGARSLYVPEFLGFKTFSLCMASMIMFFMV